MKVTKVCCQGCGADLQIDESIRFVTCNYCNARLEVVHDATVTHTRQLDKIERTTDQLAGNMKVIELQNDLERLDREWDNQRNSLLVRGKNGHVSEPSSTGSMVGGVVMIVFGQAVSRDWKSRRMAKYAERSRNLGLCGRWAGRKRRRPRF